jgi:hypothetical protein
MIDFTDTHAVRQLRPFLAAHRGGVIKGDAPECSLPAIRLAAEQGYRMVELDAQESKDGEPVMFHDRTLTRMCGVNEEIRELTSDEIRKIPYRASEQLIATLDEGLALCRSLNLWVMLDIKVSETTPSTEVFFDRISILLKQHALTRSTVTISMHPLAEKHLAGQLQFTVTGDEVRQVQEGTSVSLKQKFWFGLPEDLPSSLVPRLQQCGALVIPAINTFRYPLHAERELARKDVERLLEADVDGFQIDSVYRDLF